MEFIILAAFIVPWIILRIEAYCHWQVDMIMKKEDYKTEQTNSQSKLSDWVIKTAN